MSALFFEGRTPPAAIRQQFSMGRHYADAGADIVAGLKAVSPWDFLTGVFVTKPAQAEQAALQQQEMQAQAVAMQQAQQAKTVRTVMIAGAGLVGVIILAVALRSPKHTAVHGYRKRRHR
jgi:hypothetical protein